MQQAACRADLKFFAQLPLSRLCKYLVCPAFCINVFFFLNNNTTFSHGICVNFPRVK